MSLSAFISDRDFKISPYVFATDRMPAEMAVRRLLSASSSFCLNSPCNRCAIEFFILLSND